MPFCGWKVKSAANILASKVNYILNSRNFCGRKLRKFLRECRWKGVFLLLGVKWNHAFDRNLMFISYLSLTEMSPSPLYARRSESIFLFCATYSGKVALEIIADPEIIRDVIGRRSGRMTQQYAKRRPTVLSAKYHSAATTRWFSTSATPYVA